MPLSQSVTTSFKVEILQGIHHFGPSNQDTFKIALYTANASLGPTTTEYTSTEEITGTGYGPGGIDLMVNPTPSSGTNVQQIPTAFVSFDPAEWNNATFTARGALIYNSTQGNKSVAVLDFGSDKSVSNSTFTVTFPAANANDAIIRIA